MRGKGRIEPRKIRRAGITPAYAGKRNITYSNTYEAKDHPRVCGEKILEFLHVVAQRGSPPRMRGKEDLTRSDDSVTGITPAYAGKSAVGDC